MMNVIESDAYIATAMGLHSNLFVFLEGVFDFHAFSAEKLP